MKKAFLIAVLVALSLTVAAQKRVAVYVEGKDAKLSAEVAGEMVRAIFWGLCTGVGIAAIISTSPMNVDEGEEWKPLPFGVACAGTALCASQFIYKIMKPKIGKNKIKKAINMYNSSRNAWADNLELQFGFTPTGVGLTLNF